MKTYEAMFLLDPALASNWSAAEAEVSRILQRAEAKVIGIKNWSERKLAYEIGQFKRGLYVLTFFEAEPDKIAGIERDVQLGELTIRVMVIRRDTMSPEAVEKALAAEPPSRSTGRGDEWSPRPPRSGDRYGDRPSRRDGGGPEDKEDAAVAVDDSDESDESGADESLEDKDD